MKNKYNTFKQIFVVFAAFCLLQISTSASYSAVQTPVKPAAKTTAAAPSYISVSPVEVVNHSAKYLNKNISFTAEFVAFTSLGLDYKPAYRDGSKYIGILIKREDVKDHVIPLSEMKIFLTRELAEKNVDVEAGDKIKINGKVFSTALGDPWVDVKTFTIVSKAEKKEIN